MKRPVRETKDDRLVTVRVTVLEIQRRYVLINQGRDQGWLPRASIDPNDDLSITMSVPPIDMKLRVQRGKARELDLEYD